MSATRRAAFVVTVVVVLLAGRRVQVQGPLTATVHPTLPPNPSDYWYVPAADDRAARTTVTYQPLVEGILRYQAKDYVGALAFVTRPALTGSALADYAAYYAGLSQLKLAHHAEARRILDALLDRHPAGYIGVGAALASGEAAEAVGDNAAALRIYERLADDTRTASDVVLAKLGRAALATGQRAKAADAFQRVYYEFPLTDTAAEIASALDGLRDQIATPIGDRDIGRAQLLFGARRYGEARAAFRALLPSVSGDNKELVDLRIAECDFYLKQYVAARAGVRPYLEQAARKAEARFFHLTASRDLAGHAEYARATDDFVTEFPTSSWSEEALNNLATDYILASDDEKAAQTFRRMYEMFPSGQRAERAAWRYGWWAYRSGQYAETIRVFESAAAAFPRSDYRPPFLYWAARAHGKVGEGTQADSRLRLVFTDYANSYYGRLAERHLSSRAGAATAADRIRTASFVRSPETPPAIPTAGLVRLLLANGLYDDAINELKYASRAWGSRPAIDATTAWIYNQRGELRRGISLMRRTYPQFLTAGGRDLPSEILQVIFPLMYWEPIRRNSEAHGLDPYVVAALIAQESTFDAGARSSANAWGLMQIVPSTGRKLARSIGIRYTNAKLTEPETNIRLGTLLFSKLVDRFGGSHYALASYNAGESRIARWKTERPTLDEDEFIDDIPFPETQNYVKRVLGTAEDYRLLYSGGTREAAPTLAPSKPSTASMKSAAAAKKTPTKKPATKKPTTKKPAPKKPAAKKTSSTR